MFAMSLLCNHNCFPFSEIFNVGMSDLFHVTTKISPTTFNEICFSFAKPRILNNDLIILSEINSTHGCLLKSFLTPYLCMQSSQK